MDSLVTLSDGSEKELSVVMRTMRNIRNLCLYNRTATIQLVQLARNSFHRLPKRDWQTLKSLGLLDVDGILDNDVREIVLCAFEGVPVTRDPEASFWPKNPIMHVEEE